MDPMDPGSEDLNIRNRAVDPGDVAGSHTPRPDTDGEDPLAAADRPGGGSSASGDDPTGQIVVGDLLVTVDPVDGSVVEPCPPASRPPFPVRRTAEDRAARDRAARPSQPPDGVPHHTLLPEQQEICRRVARVVARGRSVRLTGPPGSGRTTLLEAVAEDCGHLAPDGVVWLSGYRRTVKDLLYDLFATVYATEGYRPDDTLLRRLVGEIGAVVVLDDVEFGGQALEELLDATPECALVLAGTPDVPAALAEWHLEEVVLGGVGSGAGTELVRQAVRRDLTEEERRWADEVEAGCDGLLARLVQAGALLRCRDRLAAGGMPVPALPPPTGGGLIASLAALLSGSARAVLEYGVALGGELPHRAQLPALIGDPRADAALAELLASGLLTPVGARYRLAAGVQAELEAVGFGAADRARAAGEHYVWWTGHPSVAAAQVRAESDSVLGTLAALVPACTAPTDSEGGRSLAVRLARNAAPAFAAGLDWGGWERALRSGQEAARRSGEVAEEAYFHHELGVLALCTGRLDRARTELEASVGLRGVLADKRGTAAGRRALALVEERAAAAESAEQRPGPAQDGPVVPHTPPQDVQTSFGAGVPLLVPEDAPTTELREVPGELPAGPLEGPLEGPLDGPFEGPLGGSLDGPFGAPHGRTVSVTPAGPATPADDESSATTPPWPAARGSSPTVPVTLGPSGVRRTTGAPPPADDDGPGPLVSRTSGAANGPGHAKHNKRNLVAAAGGVLLAAVLGTVVTIGSTSDRGEQSSTVDPDPTTNWDDEDGGTDEEPAQQPSSPSGSTASGSGSPSASSGSPTEAREAADAPGTSRTTPGQHSDTPTRRPTTSHPSPSKTTTKPPTSRPPTSKPPTSHSPTTSPSTSEDPESPGTTDPASAHTPSAPSGNTRTAGFTPYAWSSDGTSFGTPTR